MCEFNSTGGLAMNDMSGGTARIFDGLYLSFAFRDQSRKRNRSDRCQSSSRFSRVLSAPDGIKLSLRMRGARPNHVGAAIARHKRAGRIEEHDGKLYARSSTGMSNRPPCD